MQRYINFHSHHPDPSAQITLINSSPDNFNPERGCFYSCGIHPWDVSGNMNDELSKLESLLIDCHEILAVGECGLDFHHDNSNREEQENIFVQQLFLAQKYQRPVILHVVKSENRVREIIHREKINVPCIVHGFNKRETVAQEWIRKGFYLSVGSAVLEKNPVICESIKTIPLDKVFLETDNREILVSEIYKCASDILGCKEDALIDQVELNFEKLFLG